MAGIADVDVAGTVHCHADGIVEAAAQCPGRAVASRNLVDRVMPVIDGVDVAARVQRYASRMIKAATQRTLRRGRAIDQRRAAAADNAVVHLRPSARAVDIFGCDHSAAGPH